jgi:hypothetical protein
MYEYVEAVHTIVLPQIIKQQVLGHKVRSELSFVSSTKGIMMYSLQNIVCRIFYNKKNLQIFNIMKHLLYIFISSNICLVKQYSTICFYCHLIVRATIEKGIMKHIVEKNVFVFTFYFVWWPMNINKKKYAVSITVKRNNWCELYMYDKITPSYIFITCSLHRRERLYFFLLTIRLFE